MLNLTGGRRIQFSSLRIIPYVRLDRAERAIGWISSFSSVYPEDSILIPENRWIDGRLARKNRILGWNGTEFDFEGSLWGQKYFLVESLVVLLYYKSERMLNVCINLKEILNTYRPRFRMKNRLLFILRDLISLSHFLIDFNEFSFDIFDHIFLSQSKILFIFWKTSTCILMKNRSGNHKKE